MKKFNGNNIERYKIGYTVNKTIASQWKNKSLQVENSYFIGEEYKINSNGFTSLNGFH